MECVHDAMNLRTISKGWQHKKLFVSDLFKKYQELRKAYAI